MPQRRPSRSSRWRISRREYARGNEKRTTREMIPMFDKKAKVVVAKARELAAQADSWVAFSNALTAESGLVAKAFPKAKERKAFLASPYNDEINDILLGVIKKKGVTDGYVPHKSGKFVVRVPQSLHAALEIEAKNEGV